MLLNEKLFYVEGSYGGQQSWLKEFKIKNQFWADRSCGVTAAANLIMYLSRTRKELSALYQGTSSDEFVGLMKELYPFLKPRVYGIPTLTKMRQGIQRFAYSRGIRLSFYMESWVWDVNDGSDFIIRMLELDRPVLLLTWNSSNREFRNHWVTVTGMVKKKDGYDLIVSNWGRRKIYSYEEWIRDKALLRGAIAFEFDKPRAK